MAHRLAVVIRVTSLYGSGTTTQCRALCDVLRDRGHGVLATHQPSDRVIGRLVRERLAASGPALGKLQPAKDHRQGGLLLFTGDRVAIATVVRVEGSAPRPVGATMAVSASGDLAGSVSGGCVETAVFDVAQDVLATNKPTTVRYGITDEMAWDVGLACGGTIDVYIEPLDLPVEAE